MDYLSKIADAIIRFFSPKEPMVIPTPPLPVPPPTVNGQPIPKYLFDNRTNSIHSVRLLCDEQGLSLTDKNVLCACIMQESAFNNKAVNYNKNSVGKVLSTDYGICQINDYYHIGQGKDFPTVQYVLDNPDKTVLYMIRMMKAGKLNLWVSYSSGAYKHWLWMF